MIKRKHFIFNLFTFRLSSASNFQSITPEIADFPRAIRSTLKVALIKFSWGQVEFIESTSQSQVRYVSNIITYLLIFIDNVFQIIFLTFPTQRKQHLNRITNPKNTEHCDAIVSIFLVECSF